MFNIVNNVTGSIVFATSIKENAESMLAIIDTTPSTHEIVEVVDEPTE